MINLSTISLHTFLNDYWQKKPFVIHQAFNNFVPPLSPEELAGLALEEDVESRIVLETPRSAPFWQLKTGPFTTKDFKHLPKTHWTLLVQGVDRLIPEVANLLDHFTFIPQWRIDDVMISYAVNQGSVGPHYDNYDVFLFQASGRRKWTLTTQHCHPENYLENVPLRIMEKFVTEEEYILEPGDMLYLPPHVGHHGVSLSDDCMTYSFGYRSYQAKEMLTSFSDYLTEIDETPLLYEDPNWTNHQATGLIPPQAWINARNLLQQIISNEDHLKTWFGCFATQLDHQSEQLLPQPLSEDEQGESLDFIDSLLKSAGIERDAICRFAYQEKGNETQLFINGCEWNTDGVSSELTKLIANHRSISLQMLHPFLSHKNNHVLLHDLWRLQWIQLL